MLQVFKATFIRIWFVTISVLGKILSLNTRSKGKEKTKKCSSIPYLVCWALFHLLSVGLVLNRRTLAATALYETHNIPVVKKYNRFIVFLEYKPYGLPSNEWRSRRNKDSQKISKREIIFTLLLIHDKIGRTGNNIQKVLL